MSTHESSEGLSISERFVLHVPQRGCVWRHAGEMRVWRNHRRRSLSTQREQQSPFSPASTQKRPCEEVIRQCCPLRVRTSPMALFWQVLACVGSAQADGCHLYPPQLPNANVIHLCYRARVHFGGHCFTRGFQCPQLPPLSTCTFSFLGLVRG